ncbi:MAG: glycosyltransferase family 39 protein [Phycisphaerales bacterium]|nr:glycosyltransferase family 39 protein [Phycisphaerales bacterium]
MRAIRSMDDPSPTKRTLPWRLRGVLVVLSLALLLPGTFGVSLTDRDEGWYAQVAREMHTSGDWLVPTYLGEPWLAKPPLLYWCIAASFHLFGETAFAARLVSVLAMTLTVQWVAGLTAELYGRRAAGFAAASFLTFGLTVIVGKLVLTDALLVLLVTAAAWLLVRGVRRGWTWWRALAFWMVCGLGLLAKGPAIVVFVGACGAALLLWRRGRRMLLVPRLWWVAPVALLIAAPWYVVVTLRAGDTLWQQFFGYEIGARLQGGAHGGGAPPGYFLVLSLAALLPWTALVPGALLEAWQRRKREPAAGLMLVWLVLPWLFLELVPSKLPHYILPCYVPLAILLGRMWARPRPTPPPRSQRWALVLWAGSVAGVGVVTGGLALYWQGPWTPAALLASGVLATGFVVASRALLRGQLHYGWRLALAGTIGFHAVLGVGVGPALESHRLSRNLAAAVNARTMPGDTVPFFACGYDEPTLFYYARLVGRAVGSDELRVAVTTGPPRVLVVAEPTRVALDWKPGPHAARYEGFNLGKGRWAVVWVLRTDDLIVDVTEPAR